MVKQRHQPQTSESPSRGPMMFLVIGVLLVAGLVGWALTRTVDAPANIAGYTNSTDMATTATASTYDTTGSAAQATQTQPVNETAPFASATAPIVTSSNAPPPAIDGNKGDVKRISAEDLREKVKANAVTVIDVRDASAYAAAHIPGSLHIPLASVEANLDRLPKGKAIVAYCT
jgi:predicted sulfurtransferase